MMTAPIRAACAHVRPSLVLASVATMGHARAPIQTSGMVKVITRPERMIPQPAALSLVDVGTVFVTLCLCCTVDKGVELREVCLVLLHRPGHVWDLCVSEGA